MQKTWSSLKLKENIALFGNWSNFLSGSYLWILLPDFSSIQSSLLISTIFLDFLIAKVLKVSASWLRTQVAILCMLKPHKIQWNLFPTSHASDGTTSTRPFHQPLISHPSSILICLLETQLGSTPEPADKLMPFPFRVLLFPLGHLWSSQSITTGHHSFPLPDTLSAD